ncbi:MAG: methionyl-tRNA formyltransferase [Gemmataceae bacterium]
MRIVMMGTGTFAEPTFTALLQGGANVVGLVTQPERGTGRKGGSTRQTGLGMAAIAATAQVPVLQPESINTPEGVAALAALQPDLLVVAAYGQILAAEVLAVPPLGAINVHASLLPKYRGAAPVAHAILAGDTVTGVTIIRISLGLDAGAMLRQAALGIDPQETAGELEARLAPLGAQLAMNVLQAWPVTGVRQDPALVTRAPKLRKEMGLLNWADSAQSLQCRIRALQPWPTPVTFLHRAGKPALRLILTRATVVPGAADPGTPVLTPGRLLIGTGHHLLEITELQPAGKKRMTAAEFLRGTPVQATDLFRADESV